MSKRDRERERERGWEGQADEHRLAAAPARPRTRRVLRQCAVHPAQCRAIRQETPRQRGAPPPPLRPLFSFSPTLSRLSFISSPPASLPFALTALALALALSGHMPRAGVVTAGIRLAGLKLERRPTFTVGQRVRVQRNIVFKHLPKLKDGFDAVGCEGTVIRTYDNAQISADRCAGVLLIPNHTLHRFPHVASIVV